MPTFKVTLTGANFYALRDAINAASPPAPSKPPLPVILGCTGRGCPISSPKPSGSTDDPSATTPPGTCEVRFAASSNALSWLNHYDGLNALQGLTWTGVEES